MSSFMDDVDVIDQTAIETTLPQYAAAQWLNGDPKMASAGGIMHTGGVVLPEKWVDSGIAPIPGWTWATVAFSTGASEKALATPKATLAVIRTRFRWIKTVAGQKYYFPRAEYREGMRGHLQALVWAKGFDFPMTLTLKGKSGQTFEQLLKEFDAKVGGAAFKVKKVAYPRFAFYLKLKPGPHIKVGPKGQESIVTPPTLDLPEVITDEYLSKAYVGRETLLALQETFHQAGEWSKAWNQGTPEPEPVEEMPTADPETGEVIDVWNKAQADGAVKAAGIKDSDVKAALQRANGSFEYVPARDTALVRQLVNDALAQF